MKYTKQQQTERNQMKNQVDLYTSVHKGQRARFSTISRAAGVLNTNDQNALSALESELASFRDHMYLHANLEEKFIHPLLSERIPGGANKLNEDHRIMHRQFDDLLACFAKMKKKPTDFEKREELSLEFYLAWSRFTSFYLNHIDYEEEYVMPALWKLCTNDELSNTFRQIMAAQTPKELMDSLGMMLPALNPTERAMILNMGRATMPPEAFQAALKLAEQVLTHEEWATLKTMLK
jgi:hemerythrin-like domain-containing protein